MLASLLLPLSGQIPLTEDERLFVTGDAQLRYESHDTTRPSTKRQERVRLTAHLIAGYKVADAVTARVGARTGELTNQHSPTVTLWQIDDDHGYGRRSYYLDRWELEYKAGPWRALLGRTIWPFYGVTDYIWDRDVNPAGIYGAYSWKGAEASTSLAAAYYALPDGALSFTGTVATAQVRMVRPLGGGNLTAAFQWMQMGGGSQAKYPRARNNERDYAIGQFSLAYGWRVFGKPASVGFDLFHNFASYNDPADVFAYANRDDDSGFGLGLSWGQNRKAGDWRFRYNYTYQEALSVNPSTSEDTFSRLGTSNYKGHDFRVIYSILDSLTIMARLKLSEEIKGSASADRFRIDLLYQF